jgi:putative glycosyltransferase (exosortase G-associated)
MEIVPSIGSLFILWKRKIFPQKIEKPQIYPEISIIIPVYNSQDTLEACIRSIHESTYPDSQMKVFLVNNQTKDNSFTVFSRCQEKYKDLHMQWMNAQQGKSRALNLALYNSGGKYIVHIDSDGQLEPHALTNLVDRFENDTSVNCMTGSILTMPEMIEEYPFGLSRLFRKLEFVEYAQAFLAGRNYASDINAIYTLSGAFSAFRKSAILKSWLYSTDTICEDTHITFQMKYMQHEKVKISENSIFFVDPIESVDKLYTQRQRWQRGSLEVSKMFLEKRLKPWKMFTDVNVQTLMYDHTFAFPRLIWYLALICLIFCGFSAKTIGLTTALIFAMYIFCGYMYYFAISGFLQEFTEIRKYYRKQWWVIPFMPFFNLLVFFIRVAGVVNSIGTDSAWKTMTLTDEGKAFRGQILKDIDVILSHIKRFRDLVNNDAEKQTT